LFVRFFFSNPLFPNVQKKNQQTIRTHTLENSLIFFFSFKKAAKTTIFKKQNKQNKTYRTVSIPTRQKCSFLLEISKFSEVEKLKERQLIVVSFFKIFAEDKSSFGLSCDTLFFRHIYINIHIIERKKKQNMSWSEDVFFWESHWENFLIELRNKPIFEFFFLFWIIIIIIILFFKSWSNHLLNPVSVSHIKSFFFNYYSFRTDYENWLCDLFFILFFLIFFHFGVSLYYILDSCLCYHEYCVSQVKKKLSSHQPYDYCTPPFDDLFFIFPVRPVARCRF
jgi:hypothetical protein